jgi:serine/threonine-protein kinase
MAGHEHQIRPQTPASFESNEHGRTATLPSDVVRLAGRRLGLAALVYAGAYFLAYGSGRVSGTENEWWIEAAARVPLTPDAWAGMFIALALGMFVFTRYHRVAPERLLTIGLVFEVVAAYGIDIYLMWGMWPETTVIAGISWVAVWIVFYPMIVPATPMRTLLASLAAATATPVLYYIGVWRGGVPLPDSHLFQMFAANLICVGMAVVGSRVIYRLGSDVNRARRMGAYRLMRKLGEGGMGEVWMAEHHLLARPAAIKLVRGASGPEVSPSDSQSHHHRFEREVQATSQLRSPHTIEVYDFGRTDDGRFYYVMELLDGLSLEELVQKFGPVPAERAIAILRQICHSLAEAHARGLVHRDIKPANIFVCRYGLEHDFVKVLDFGLVKATGASTDVRLTDVGSFAGTPAYGSPESALGENLDVDGRSDLYSLGCVAYWLLTGRTVFDATQPIQMLVQHANQPPDPPSSVTELSIPPELDALVLQLLSKSPEDRPATADETERQLAAIPVATGRWTRERAREWWDTHQPAAEYFGILSLDAPGNGRVIQPAVADSET